MRPSESGWFPIAEARTRNGSRDGKQLYYLAPDKRIMAVAVDTAHERFTAGVPRALFQSDIVNDFRARFAVTSDGQRFLIPSAAGQGGLP